MENCCAGSNIKPTTLHFHEVLASLSPYWRDHLNRFGVFTLDMERNTTEIDYKLANH